MLPLSTDDDGEDAPQPPFMFLRSLKSSNSNYYEPVPGWPRRRWRILRAQPIELPTLRDRSHSPWRARRRRIIRQLLMAILLVAFTLLVLIHQFFRAHGYRKEDAVETFRRLFRPSTLVFDQRELRRVWEWEILSGHYPSRRTGACFCALTALLLYFKPQLSQSQSRSGFVFSQSIFHGNI